MDYKDENDSYLKKGMKDENEKVHKVAMMKAAMKSSKKKGLHDPALDKHKGVNTKKSNHRTGDKTFMISE